MCMKKIAALSLLLWGAFSLGAQTVEFPWLSLPQGTVSLGMAGTGTLSDYNLAWSSSNSPAIAALGDRKFAVEGAYSLIRPSGLNRVGIGSAGKIGKRLSLGGSVSFVAGNKYDVYNSTGLRTGDFTPYMFGMNVGAGVKLTGFMSLGVSLLYAREVSSVEAKYNALSASLMFAFRHRGFRAGAGVHSLGAGLGSGGGVTAFPSSAKLTAGYDNALCSGSLRLSAYADADYYFNNSVSVAAGAAVGYKEIVTLRGGYRYSSSAAPLPSFATAGMGFGLKGIALDFAYILSKSHIRNSFQAGIRYSF